MKNDADYTSPELEVEATSPKAAREAQKVETWLRELDLALEREKDFRKTGREVVELYECQKAEQSRHQFNILYSNTETLAPALYNSTPRPVVQRRFKDEDKLGKMAASTCERVLEFLIDPGESEYSPFDGLMSSAVLEALLPGRGVTRFKYEPSFNEVGEEVTAETVCGEEVPWEMFRHGYGKKWAQVPWVSFEHRFSKEEVEETFGEEIANALTFDEYFETTRDDQTDKDYPERTTQGTKLAQVFEIWDRTTKRVLFISPCYKDKPLKEGGDPLKLQGFFPCPQPLQMFQKISSVTPTAIYQTYREQARELNAVTYRINLLVRALKVRGAYDANLGDIANILTADDNVLKPVDNVAALYGSSGAGGLDKAIWLMPIEKLIAVVQQLYLAREQIKQTIYEITGIADIMRGSSQASETLGAQEIKNQWGTLRLKRAQKRVANYVRESLRIMAEIAVTNFSVDTLSKMTGLPWPTQEVKQQAQVQAQQLQVIAQQAQQQAQATSQQPPQPPEQWQQQMQQVQMILQTPSWDDVVGLLQSDLLRSYRIDIETNSTVDAEATEDKQNITDLTNALAQLLNGLAPLVESGTLPFEFAKAMMLTIVRRFRFGPELEDSLEGMRAPEPKPDPKAQALEAKAKMDQQSAELKSKQEQEKHQLEMQKMQGELAIKQREAQMQLAVKQAELDLKREELAMKAQELQLKREDMVVQSQLKRQDMAMQAEMSREQHRQGLETTAANTSATLATAAAKQKAASTPPAKKDSK